MKVNIDIDEKYTETFVTIHVKEWSEEIEQVVTQLRQTKPKRIVGVRQEQSILIDPREVEYVVAENRKVFAIIQQQRIELKMKLYEIEQLFETFEFTRFSKSVIGNINLIHRFELSFNGNLCVIFRSGNKEYVSRKYVKSVKNKLQIGDINGI